MKYKLLTLDLDGTALGKDPNRLAPGVAEAAAQAAAAGCIVAAATGRPAKCLPADLEPYPAWLSWLVLYDGAEIRNARTGECIWRKAFTADALDTISRAAEKLGIPMEYIDRDSCYHVSQKDLEVLQTSGLNAFHKGILARYSRPLEGPISEQAGREILKINIPLVPQEVRGAFREMAGDGVLLMDCGPGGMEATAADAGKKPAVAYLAQYLGFTLQDVMALGDSGNDAALLSAAGLGVAMGNAQPEVKAAAKAVTGLNTEGGAADAIRRWLLNE